MSDEKTKDQRSRGVNRRRTSQIVRDERGNARVELIEAGFTGEQLERAPLSIENTPARGNNGRLAVERLRSGGFDPYQRVASAGIREKPKKPQGKRDLRKLGEWIKLKRDLDARKTSDDDVE